MGRARLLWLSAGISLLFALLTWWQANSCYGDGCIGIGMIAIGSTLLTLFLAAIAVIVSFSGSDN